MKKNIFKTLTLAGLLFAFAAPSQVLANENDSTSREKLEFSTFLEEVSKNNLSYIAEKYNVSIAQAEAIAAKVFNDPDLNFEATHENYTVEMEYALGLGKRRANKRLAKSEAEMAKLEFEAFFQELRAEASDAFFEALMQRELLKVKKSSYQYMLQLSTSDSIRLSLHEITENEARQTRLETSTLLAEVYQQEAETRAALLALNQFMGKGYDAVNHPAGDWSKLDRNFVLADLMGMAMVERVDIMLAAQNKIIAKDKLRVTKAERRMDLGLKVAYERDYENYYPTSREMLKAGVSIPLQFSNLNRASIRAAKYAIEQSEYEYKDAELQIQSEVVQAFYEYESAQKQMKLYVSGGLLEDSKKVLDGIVYTYQRGESDILEVLVAQRTYNEVQEQYLEVMKNYASALIELEKTCGFWDISF